MIHLGFKEAAGRVGSIENLSKIADALAEGEATQIMLYHELANAAELRLFCRAVLMMPLINSIEQLQTEKTKLQNEVDELNKELSTKNDERRARKVREEEAESATNEGVHVSAIRSGG